MNRFFFFFISPSSVKSCSQFFNRTSLSSFSTSTLPPPSTLSWKPIIYCTSGLKSPLTLNLTLKSTFHLQFYSTTTAAAPPAVRKRSKKKADPPLLSSPLTMEEEKDAFYVVRKGDIVGVYKTLDDCQAQVGSTVCDPSVSVYKGYSLPKEAEEYMTARGLKRPLYTINATDAREDLFGTLVLCPFQQPDTSTDKTSSKPSQPKRSQEVLESASDLEVLGSAFATDTSSRKHLKLDNSAMVQANYRKCVSCTLEFDGACRGNPGPSGAGAVLKADDGSLVCNLREGIGIATNNVAEYRSLLLGLRHALKKGFSRIRVQGDSKLVCMQVQGLWKCKNENMASLCKETKELVERFISFQISHVLRDFNSAADAQANLALNLEDGEVQEICEEM